jgi:hypothetical protein
MPLVIAAAPLTLGAPRGHSLMVKFQSSKLAMRVRFPLPAPPSSSVLPAHEGCGRGFPRLHARPLRGFVSIRSRGHHPNP